MTLPEKIAIDDFEQFITPLNGDEKKIIQKAYQKNKTDYTLSNKSIRDKSRMSQILEIFQSQDSELLTEDHDKGNKPGDENSDEELSPLQMKVEEQESQIKAYNDKILEYEDLLKRRQAEFDNYRKRTLREKEEFQKSANQKIIEELLTIVDNFEKAIDSSNEDAKSSTLYDGIILIEKQIKKLLENHGVQAIESLGQEFDPNLHEALQIDESITKYKVDTVINEWQKGYTLNTKVIRHAKVVVAKGKVSEQETPNSNRPIPKTISANDFEGQILEKIEDTDDKQFISDAYQKIQNEYLLKDIIQQDDSKKEKLSGILKSIEYEKDQVKSR